MLTLDLADGIRKRAYPDDSARWRDLTTEQKEPWMRAAEFVLMLVEDRELVSKSDETRDD